MNCHKLLRALVGVIWVLLLTTGCGAPTATPTPAVTAAPVTATPQATPTPILSAPVAEIAAYIEELASQDQFSGAVLIALDGRPIWKAAYGLADRSFNVPNQIDTKFDLGSMDKMFTAVAIMQLVEQGKLSVNDKIIQHLPDYPNQEVARKVTIQHLLLHTSGMGDCFAGEFFNIPKDKFRKPADLLPLFVDKPLQFEPGTQFFYSNEGFVVLGLILEKVTGQSYYDYVQQNIFDPSGMINTAAYEMDAIVPNLAIGYTTQDAEGNDVGRLMSNVYLMPARGGPAGGGYSTVEDLLSFTNALLSHKLLSPDSRKTLLEGKVVVRENSSYAYGFFDRRINGQRVVGHGGGAPGICSFMNIYLESGYTVIVLTNTDQDCIPVMQFVQEHLK